MHCVKLQAFNQSSICNKSSAATNTCLSWQTQNMSFVVTKVCLSRQNYVCCDKSFVMTNTWCDKHMFVVTNMFCSNKHTFVVTKARQTHVCCDKSCCDKTMFSRHAYFWQEKTFVAMKKILMQAPTSDNGSAQKAEISAIVAIRKHLGLILRWGAQQVFI